MEISMFGTLQVRDGDRHLGPRDLGGVKPRQILEVLLLARGHLVCSDVISAALWPEGGEPRNVVATLNTYVCVLRHHMFVDQARARRIIVTGPAAYRLVLDDIELDLDRFDDLLLRAERAPRAERLRLRTEASELASGPLLEHARYDDWVQEDRLIYEDKTVRTYLDLALDWLAEGEFAIGLRNAETALRRDPLAEEAHGLVMLANYGLGRHDAVRRALQRCRRVLAQELGVVCAPETERLVEAIERRIPASDILRSLMPTARDDSPTRSVA